MPEVSTGLESVLAVIEVHKLRSLWPRTCVVRGGSSLSRTLQREGTQASKRREGWRDQRVAKRHHGLGVKSTCSNSTWQTQILNQ